MKKLISVFTIVGALFLSNMMYGQRKNSLNRVNTNPGAAILRHISSHPVANPAWMQFKKSELYIARNSKFGNSFSNPSHTYTMDDGSKLTINFQKKPAYGGAGNQINIHATPGAPVHGASNQSWSCSSSNVTLTAKSTDFNVADYSLQAPFIYPGAIYSFDNYVSGSYASTPGKRNPIKVFTNDRNINGNNSVEVNNPNQQSLNNAIAQLSHRFPTNYNGNGATDFNYFESDNSAAMALQLTAGGSGYGLSFNSSFGQTKNSKNLYITVDVKKALFAISALPPQNGYYSDPSVEANTPDLMTIGTVTYGIRILANITIQLSSGSEATAIEGGLNEGGLSGSAELNLLQQYSGDITNINAYEIGGPNVGAVQLNKNNLLRNINKILSGATYQNAQPVDYQLFDMAGDVIGSSSATDVFNQVTCVPNPTASTPILTSATVSIDCGPDGKDDNTIYEYDLNNSANQQVGYYRMPKNASTKWDNNSVGNSGDHLAITGSPKLTDFMNGSCTFRMSIHPQGGFGNDDVDMSQITLTLTFTYPNGNPPQIFILKWSNIKLTKGGPTVNLLFNSYNGGGFQTQQ